MRLKDFHATQIDLSEMEDPDMRPKRDHKGKDKLRKAAGGASKNYKKRLNELRDEDAQNTDY